MKAHSWLMLKVLIIQNGILALRKWVTEKLNFPAAQQKTAFDQYINNCVKNMVAYVDYAKESIQNDAVEAEKNLASKMAEEINRKAKERVANTNKEVNKNNIAMVH